MYVKVDTSTAMGAVRVPLGGTTKNGMFSRASPADSCSAYVDDRVPSGTVHSNDTGQAQSSMSSSWKWIAPYSCGACRQHISRPLHREPVIPRAGTLTRTP